MRQPAVAQLPERQAHEVEEVAHGFKRPVPLPTAAGTLATVQVTMMAATPRSKRQERPCGRCQCLPPPPPPRWHHLVHGAALINITA